jgi:membrane-bound ClpP family serine protease
MSKQNIENTKKETFALGKENYKLLTIGLFVILIGFLLMIGGGSDDPNVFNPEVFSFRRITLAPVIVLAGFLFEIYAIMKKPKSTKE